MAQPLLRDALPTVAADLRESLLREGEQALAEQIDSARVYALCECGRPECTSFWLAPPTRGPGPPGSTYRVVTPDAVWTIGVLDEQMQLVEDHRLNLNDPNDSRRNEYDALLGVVPLHPLDAEILDHRKRRLVRSLGSATEEP